MYITLENNLCGQNNWRDGYEANEMQAMYWMLTQINAVLVLFRYCSHWTIIAQWWVNTNGHSQISKPKSKKIPAIARHPHLPSQILRNRWRTCRPFSKAQPKTWAFECKIRWTCYHQMKIKRTTECFCTGRRYPPSPVEGKLWSRAIYRGGETQSNILQTLLLHSLVKVNACNDL